MAVGDELPSLDKVQDLLRQTMRADRFRLRRSLDKVRQSFGQGRSIDSAVIKLWADTEQAVQRRILRAKQLPQPKYDAELPIFEKRQEILDALRDNPVIVVSGETGSGKSTQLPKICLEAGFGVEGLIGHTQPRRLAARSVAARLASELGSPLGTDVGFKIRFTDSTSPRTYIKLMTDGILLAETQHDRWLNQYDVLIIDEAHERSLNIDFLLGYTRRLLDRRSDLRLIITSATIDSARFAEHFAQADRPAPVIEVSGRTYPVEVRYRPPASDDESGDDADVQRSVTEAIDELAADDGGDVLVFLPTERDIRDIARVLRGHLLRSQQARTTEVLPLYARLTSKEQNRIFEAHSKRRIVLATNVAESSLTVPGIRSVVDLGTARISRFAPRSKVQRLPIEPVSRASADQRKGRCGRIAPGICIRLYSEDDYNSREQYTTPEIRRTNLASVILQTKALKLGEIEDFPFLDPPSAEAVRSGYRTLFELGAINDRNELTEVGRRLSRIPTDPRIARILLAGHDENCLHEILIIAAALEIQDPRERPIDKQQAADEQHARFAVENSDFLSYLKLWDFYHNLREQTSRNGLRRACRQQFLSHTRLREWLDVHRQLKQIVEQLGLKLQSRRDDYEEIHRALLPGLLSNLAMLTDKYEYTGAGGTRFHLWPGSAAFKQRPKWIVAAELVETSRRFLRTAARINPSWIEPLAQHLLKRTYSEPHFHRRSGAVMAFERVTLYGLPVVLRRRVAYGAIDPIASRELFIREGLVEQQLESSATFYRANARLMDHVTALRDKSRRRDLFIDQQRCLDFYEEHLPDDIFDAARLNRALKADRGLDARLTMSLSDLLDEDPETIASENFPDELDVGVTCVPVSYRFEPGHEQDGITATVPIEALQQLRPDQLGWLVPGMLEEKVVALIRSLPKPIRRSLVPAPDVAKRAIAELQFGNGPFLPAVAAALSRVSGEEVPVDAFRPHKLAQHLELNLEVLDEQQQKIASGRDLVELRRRLDVEASDQASEIRCTEWHRDGITEWDLDEFPEEVTLQRGGVTLPAYPSLLDREQSVSLRLLDSKPHAHLSTRRGLRRLFCLAEHRQLKSQVNWLPDLNQTILHAATYASANQLKDELRVLIAERSCFPQLRAEIPRDRAQYEAWHEKARQRIPAATQDVLKLNGKLFASYHQVLLELEDMTAARYADCVADLREQLSRLVTPHFMIDVPWCWLEHYPRYFAAMTMRLDKLRSGGLDRDRELLSEVQWLSAKHDERFQSHRERGMYDAELVQYRWMLEEYRVSLFAQTLGTSQTVSSQRLEKQWKKVQP